MERRISVEECAELMEASPAYIRLGLRQGKFPWGYAVKGTGNRYRYYINAPKFYEMEGIQVCNI